MSTVKCGVGSGKVQRESVNSSVSVLKPITTYTAEGNTPLFDSVGDLVELMEKAPDAGESDVSFLVMAITDGQENASKRYNADAISKLIREKQSTDRWTFVFRVPHGYSHELTRLGIPAGNIQEWEQTERGFKEATNLTRQAFANYYDARATSNLRSTDAFYANLSGVTPAMLRNSMDDISKEVKIKPVKRPAPIREFVEYHFGNMVLGAAFYQLTKPEKVVKSDRRICIRDKSTGSIFAGQAARQLLKLPTTGSIKLSPGDHGNYDIFVQSKSVNRKLMPGTDVLYWSNYR